MRSRAYRRACIQCERSRDICGRDRGDGVLILSAKGLCPECSADNWIESQETTVTKSQEWWDKWRKGTAASIGVKLPEDDDAAR